MSPKVSGVLVYATGKTETIDGPTGKDYVRHCDHCGSQLFFEGQSTIAEDEATKTHEQAERLRKFGIRDAPINGGCIVYIQRPTVRTK